ncbi:MAG: MotB family protein [Hyphomicrobiaceae bacterium]|jgi:chemotaxis protein MotB
MKGEETKAQELIIIRRSSGEGEGGHHGGVWKIAYADFMTAMMAFFLVMWLINSTDKKTLTQVATYFNPLRLTDKAPSARGLQQAEAGVQAQDQLSGAPKQQPGIAKSETTTQGKGEGSKPTFADEALFRDPQGMLARLATQAEEDQKPEQPGRRPGSEAYRDPFEPAFRRSQQPEKPQPSERPKSPAEPGPPAAAVGTGQQPLPPVAGAAEAAAAKEAAAREAAREAAVKEAAAREAAAMEVEAGKAAEARKTADAARKAEQAADRATAERIDAAIRGAIAQARSGTVPNIEVKSTAEGVLISLTDDYDFGMFAIASAEPRPALVVVMEKLGKVLAHRSERLVVRGHTDGRPYKSGTYDNWRLSTARAQMAYYMLLRGGIDEKRFERIEGHADRDLRVADDPEAAQNRRIEILLRKAKP